MVFKSWLSQLVLLLIQILFTISVVGSYTSWFRSEIDLIETLFLLMHFAFVIFLILPGHIIWAIRRRAGKKCSGVMKFCVLATIVCCANTVYYNMSFFGRMYAPLEGSVIRERVSSFVDTDNHKVDWWVEYVNPFHEKHKERLILSDGNGKRIIDMKLVEQKGRFTYHGNKIHLEQTGSNLLLKSEAEIAPHTRFVLIDYKSGSVLSNWVEEAAWSISKRERAQSNLVINAEETPPRSVEGVSGSEEINQERGQSRMALP